MLKKKSVWKMWVLKTNVNFVSMLIKVIKVNDRVNESKLFAVRTFKIINWRKISYKYWTVVIIGHA